MEITLMNLKEIIHSVDSYINQNLTKMALIIAVSLFAFILMKTTFHRKKVLNRALYKKRNYLERQKLTKSLRYDILKRDHFRCVICGRNAKNGVLLEVDHIIPISKGGKTEPKNLQTLCFSCNRGKRNK